MTPPPIESVALRGGRLCLDFVNTANWGSGVAADERLTRAADMDVWLKRHGLAGALPEGVDLTRLRRLRLAIRRIFASDATATPDDLAVLAAARGEAPPPLTLAAVAADAAHACNAQLGGSLTETELARVLADSAVELALTADLKRIKTCAAENCGWVFFDESPSNRRRWCSMSDCGNRAKARRHYRAKRASAAPND